MTICRKNETSLKWYHSKRFKMKLWNCRIKKMNHVYLKASVCRDENKIAQCEKYSNIEKWVFQHLFTSSVWIRYLLSTIFFISTFCSFASIFAMVFTRFSTIQNEELLPFSSTASRVPFFVFFFSCLFVFFIFFLAVCGKRVAKIYNNTSDFRTNKWHVYTMRTRAFATMVLNRNKQKDLFCLFHPFSSNNNLSGTFCLRFCRHQNWKISYDNVLLLLLQNIQSGYCCRLYNKIKSI